MWLARGAGPASLGAKTGAPVFFQPDVGAAVSANEEVDESGPNGIYLSELLAQPGGPEGRPHTTAGSEAIKVIGRPRDDRSMLSLPGVRVEDFFFSSRPKPGEQ